MAANVEMVRAYSGMLSDVSADARKRVGSALEKVDWTDVAAARDACIEIFESYLPGYADMAAQLSSEFYSIMMEAHGVASGYKPIAAHERKREATEEAIRALVRFAAQGDSGKTVSALLQRVDYEIGKAANDCIFANIRRDPAKPRFARVPSGAETCKFCLMLAGRGPVYYSSEVAGENNHYHAGCDCRIVPFFGSNRLAGYDPQEYRDALETEFWNEAKAQLEREGKELDDYTIGERASELEGDFYEKVKESAKRSKERHREAVQAQARARYRYNRDNKTS